MTGEDKAVAVGGVDPPALPVDVVVPRNLWDKYRDRLTHYNEKRKEIQGFIGEELIEGPDYGQTFELSDYDRNHGKKESHTLKKPGSLKIQQLMESQVKMYPDVGAWRMLGEPKGTVAFVGYVIDRDLLGMILQYLPAVGFEYEQAVVRLFAWGEGRGAAELDEKVYSGKHPKAGKPLAGAANRALKMAEKRCDVDAVIRTFGLEFSQDEEYRNDGRLRGETPEDTAVEKVQAKHKVSEQAAGCYTAIMSQLGQHVKGKPVFLPDEAVKIKKQADEAVEKGDDAIVNFYKSIQIEAAARMKKLTGGANA